MTLRTFALLPLLVMLLACPSPEAGDGPSTSDEPTPTATDPTTSPGTTMPSDDTTAGGMTGTTTGPAATEDTAEAEVDSGFFFDVGGVADLGEGGCGPGPDTNATLTGTVWAPNGEIPISNALVYTTTVPPAGIPQNVYCDECQAVNCSDFFTFTNVDGTFSLDTQAGEGRYLVVKKGQFMRVTTLDIAEGSSGLATSRTTLPGQNNPAAGQYIPLIAVGYGSFDRIEDALGKFGMGQTNITGFEENLVPGTEPFDIWDNGGGPAFDGFTSQGTFAQLIADPSRLDDYHIIFVPCSTDDFVANLNPATIQNIQDWVAAGGRWYVADWSNEWMEFVFPDYQTLDGEPNNADGGVYDSDASVLDADLLAWLQALPNPLKDINPLNDEPHPTLFDLPAFVTTVDNWSVVEQVHPILVDDGMGGQEDVGHKVWLEGPGGGFPVHPLTVSGIYGCGRIQFTSYHAAEFFDYVGLSPQELVLLYTILEIGVCQDNPLPPPQG
ncbi:MAG: hypothetical protein AB1Z98_05410 [Nannocystaceae bacterium]